MPCPFLRNKVVYETTISAILFFAFFFNVKESYGQILDSIDCNEHPVFALHIPDMCAGNTYNLNFGYEDNASIVLRTSITTLAVADTIFLPDGVYCEPYGCSYRSAVTFSDFSHLAHIQSEEDIYYLRLNLEHSYCQDIYINLTCPNGQKADIMKYGGVGSSTCNSSIPSTSRGWSIGSNTSGSADFGIASAAGSNSNKCLSIYFPMGTGWNYCWSNNTNQGYQYAPGAGSLIYRSVNTHDNRLDSSDVANHSNFYHPDQSFSNLIGCPMNGTWYIEVMDGWSVDNGYIFGWELSLAPELQPLHNFVLDSFSIIGPWVNIVDSTNFTISPPITLQNDTVVTYIVYLYDGQGCVYDTTFNVNIWIPRDTLIHQELCAGEVLNFSGFNYTAPQNNTSADTILVRTIETSHGCDSTIYLHLTTHPLFQSHDTIQIYSRQLPYTLHGETIPIEAPEISTHNFTFQSIQGCDSLVSTTLIVLYPDTTRIDSIICAYALPYVWHGINLTTDTTVNVTLTAQSGRDSIVFFSLHVVPNSIGYINLDRSTCAGDTLDVSIGFNADASIFLTQFEASHHETEKIFLPDGMNCAPYGTYYRSYAQFSDFVPGSVIQSANDIRYLRMKIEHSAIEDLRITLVCPNGNSCKIVPDEQFDGWGSVPHEAFRINLGVANRQVETLSCDSTLNPIGVPWNYVWSNNTTLGYQYAPGTYGYCYEPVNIHVRDNPVWDNSNNIGSYSYIIDSSNVTYMTQIYHPLQNFNSLTGCPLNGNWYIEVQDLQEYDNGYLVEWELAFDPSLLRMITPQVVSRDLTGPWANRITDSTFRITPPANLTADTNITYTISVLDSYGCTFDTTIVIRFFATQQITVYDTILQNQLPYVYNQHLFPIGSPIDNQHVFYLQTLHGCDSIVDYRLHIFPNDTIFLTDTTCESDLPYMWNGLTFYQAGTLSQSFTNIHGADSVLFLTLVTLPSTQTFIEDFHCQGEAYQQNGFNLPEESTQTSSTFSMTYSNHSGCDSTVFLVLTIIPNTTSTIEIDIPENQLPYSFHGEIFTQDTTGVVLHTVNSAGCDSIINLSVFVHYNQQFSIDTILCDNEMPLLWNGQYINTSTPTTVTLHDIYGADSTITLNLDVIDTDIEIECLTENFCDEMRSTLQVHTSMDDYVWSTGESTPIITVYSPGNYTVSATQGQCHALANHTISVCNLEIFLPNAITPGIYDGLNDKFFLPESYLPQIAENPFSITIFNRFGEVVFHSTDKRFRWDGTYKGQLHRNNTYNYIIRYQNIMGEEFLLKGNIITL